MEATKLLSESCYCRLCAEPNKNGNDLFSSEENSDDLSVLVNRYLPLKVEKDGKYPTLICPGCHIQLEATKSFMDLIIVGQTKLRDLYHIQQETSQREEKQRQKLEKVLHTVNPNSTVETYTIESDETGEKFLIQIFSEGPLFPPEHELSLRMEGLEKPKRKRGRPCKQASDINKEQDENKLINKEEEIIQQEEEIEDADGRKRRKIRAPARYQGVVQGKELDRIFKEEGVTDDDEIDTSDVMTSNEIEELIGRTETENGEDLGEPIFITKQKLKNKNGSYFHKRKIKKKYQCEICNKEFLHIGRYEFHKKSHKIHYVCQESNCGIENVSKTILEQHQSETGHSGISAIEKVEAVGGAIVLPEGAEIAEAPKLDPADSQKVQYKCLGCEKNFSCKQNLDVHNRAVHNQEKPFSCDKCQRSFSYANSLKLHMMKHSKDATKLVSSTPSKEYPCNICGKVLLHPSSLVYHKETKHGCGRRFVCNKCDKSFKHRQLLQRHQLVHSDERPFPCELCNASFKTLANLINHEAVHSGDKKFVCNQCGQKFAHRTSLTLHQRWHEGHKPFKCDVCNKSFSQKGNLAEHKRIHTGEKPYRCDHCGRSFTTSSQFNLHRKRHTGERPWVCQYCSKSFLHRDTFKAHLRRHLNDRPFKCEICARAFTEAWALKRHERIHLGIKPYTCEQCGKTFTDSSNKSKHMRTHRNHNVKHVYTNRSILNMKNSSSLLQVLDPSMSVEKQKENMNVENDLQLTQLVDQQGNPISITTQDGQTVPVVTGSNDESSIQGLLPDGTLVPIEITTLQEKEIVENIQELDENDQSLLNEDIQNEINILKEGVHIDQDAHNAQKLDTNIQFITGDDGQEVCLVTYAMDDNNSINQQLEIDTFLIDDSDLKK